MAVGFGLAIAKAGNQRRAAKRRRSGRRLQLLRHELPAEGLRRMVLAQVDLALEQLGSEGHGHQQSPHDDEHAVHEIRKAIKRLRALLRLLAAELGEEAHAREDAFLRDLARSLAQARDAEAMLETLDGLLARHPKRLGRRRGVSRRLRAVLEQERERARRRTTLADPTRRGRASGELRAFRARASAWTLGSSGGDRHRRVERSARDIYGRGRRRYRDAGRGKRPHAKRMHEWRKRVKDLRYAAEALQRKNDRDSSKWLRRVAERADELSELLGEEHDLAMLDAWVERSGASSARLGKRTRRELSKAIAARRRELRRQALRRGKRLYTRRPKAFARRLRVTLS